MRVRRWARRLPLNLVAADVSPLHASPSISQSRLTSGATVQRLKAPTLVSYILALACLVAVPATAQVNYAVSGDTAYVASSPNASGNIVIASTYNGFPVTRIADSAFSHCTSLTNVTIPDSVSYIGLEAFRACISLTSVAIPNSVTSMGYAAFTDCSNLTSVTIGNSVTSIGDAVFSDCTSLTSVTVPNSVTSIEWCAFCGCTSLTNVTVPDSVTYIGGSAFSSCTSLTGVTIPNSVTSIGYFAFTGCTSLPSVTLGNSVTRIGGFALYGCTSLTNLTFQGNAPFLQSLDGFGGWFDNVGAGATVYYYCGTIGWGSTYGGLPTVMLLVPQIDPGSASVKPTGFGFTLTCRTNQIIVVEASTNLVNWQPIWTNTSADFVDPQWLNHPHRFYRARSVRPGAPACAASASRQLRRCSAGRRNFVTSAGIPGRKQWKVRRRCGRQQCPPVERTFFVHRCA